MQRHEKAMKETTNQCPFMTFTLKNNMDLRYQKGSCEMSFCLLPSQYHLTLPGLNTGQVKTEC